MERLVTIRTLQQLEELRAYLSDKDFVAYDVETVGTDHDTEVIGFSVAADVDVGYYVILSYWDVAQQRLVQLETRAGAADFLKCLVPKKLVMHNAPFDCEKTWVNFGVELMPSVHTDTLLLGHILDENRLNGLKELGVALFGEDARAEQIAMKQSVARNGGVLTKANYELYKADADLIAKYGAKDAILTLKVFYELVPQLFEQKLDGFFYDDESMPLLRGPTYEMNTTGLRVDPEKLETLRRQLETDCLEAKGYIYKEIEPLVRHKYPGTSKVKTFNLNAGQQLAWLCFHVLGNTFGLLTKGGKDLCKALDIPVPYSNAAKAEFVELVTENFGRVWKEGAVNKKTGVPRQIKIGNPWQYMSCGKETIGALAHRYKWAARLLELKKNEKLLSTYVIGIQTRMRYNVIRPSFLQHGTTSGRYSSRNPNFQNLPRKDKRVKACIITRPGNVFVGADYSQLEPRVFASVSRDKRLCDCFASGDDFYSVVGAPVFHIDDIASLKKEEPESFAVKYPDLRDKSKIIALAVPYGKLAWSLARMMGCSLDEAQQIIDDYLAAWPGVHDMMLESHEQAKTLGYVTNLYGRPRRMPEAMRILELYGNTDHSELPYWARNLLNLAQNHRVQSTAASIVNRSAIAFWRRCRELEKTDPRWKLVKLVLQVHDSLIVECPEALGQAVAAELQAAMELTCELPGVRLEAVPKIGLALNDV